MNLPRLLLRLFLGRRLPLTRGTLAVHGLRGRVRIHRDRWGIPHIEAEHDLDAHFALVGDPAAGAVACHSGCLWPSPDPGLGVTLV